MADESVATPTPPDAQSQAPDTPQAVAPADPRMASSKWKTYIAAAEKNRDMYLPSWRDNVNFRVMKPFGGIVGDNNLEQDRVAVPEDWSRTKQKIAQLSFQMPKIVAKAKRPEFAQAASVVTAAVNDVLNTDCRAAYVIDEILSDVINAAGLMASIVRVDIRTQEVEVEIEPPPLQVDPNTGQTLMQPMPNPDGVQKVLKQQEVYRGFALDRISPALLLWPAEFNLSDWDKAPWLGYDAYLPIELVKKIWGAKLPPNFESSGVKPDLLAKDVVDAKVFDRPEDFVRVRTIWYYASFYDSDKVHPQCIRKIVFVDGVDAPVEHEDTDWQTWVPTIPEQAEVPAGPPDPATGQPTTPGTPARPAIPGHYKGLTKLPIRVGTLVYVSDMATPPSDSSAGRAQVREKIRSRSQMLRQRDHSVPVRWFDVNRIDEDIIDALRAGTWQDMIPVNGPGDRAIGEVARAAYPRENFQFEQAIGADLDRAWSLSNNQLGLPLAGERSATEVRQVADANSVRLDYEKSRVNRYVTEIAEVLFSLMQQFQENTRYVTVIGPDGKEALQAFDQFALTGDYTFSFLADSSERIDLATRQKNIERVYNLAANSPSMNREAIEDEMMLLLGYEPARFRKPAPPPAPEKPNISYRFSGPDLFNPIAVAVMLKSGIDLGQKDIEAAIMMISDAQKALVAAGLPLVQPPLPPTPDVPVGPSDLPPDKVVPPETNEPILKRSVSGERLAA